MERPLVIGFEGLFSYNAGYVRKGLFAPLQKKYPDLECVTYSWFWGRPKIPAGRKVIVVGHSFGGDRALEFAKQIGAVACITLDPRRRWTGGGGFQTIKGVGCFNFYRLGFMKGHPVEGAQNVQLANSVGHTAVPYQPQVLKKLVELLAQEKLNSVFGK